jgi:carbon starvation protein
MFEALFILTTLDAGTRVGRYLLQDVLGNIWKPLGNTRNLQANALASVLVVAGWGYFLIQGVRDPLGGINSLWPLFGIANQLLAAIALCLGTTIILKMSLLDETNGAKTPIRKPIFALVTLLPLIWLLSVTMTAGLEKIFHPQPSIGFLAQAKDLDAKLPALEQTLADARLAGGPAIDAATKAVRTNRVLRFNNLLDAFVAGGFLILVALLVLLTLREWILLAARRKIAELKESPPVWLPHYAVAENKPIHLAGLLTLAVALAKELSGEAHLERAQQLHAFACEAQPGDPAANRAAREKAYIESTEKRFHGVTRCC